MFGMDLHRAARIAMAAHGGQVVLSNATRLLVASRLPAGRTGPAGRTRRDDLVSCRTSATVGRGRSAGEQAPH